MLFSHSYRLRTGPSLAGWGSAILQVLPAGTLMALGPQPYRGREGGRRIPVFVYFTDHSCLEQMMQPVTQPIKSTKHKQLLSLATS